MSNGTVGPKQGRVDLYGREIPEPAAEPKEAVAEGAGEKPLDLNLRPGWKSGSVVPPPPPADTSWKLAPSAATPQEVAEVAAQQVFKAAVTGFTLPLAEEAIRNQAPPDRSVAYFGSNFRNLITNYSFNARDSLHVVSGAGSAIQAYAAARRAGLNMTQAAAVGGLAAAANGASIEASQMMKGDPRTGLGVHPGSLSDVANTASGAAALAIAVGSEALEVPVLKDVLRNADRVMILPNIVKQDGRLKVDGGQVIVNIPF